MAFCSFAFNGGLDIRPMKVIILPLYIMNVFSMSKQKLTIKFACNKEVYF